MIYFRNNGNEREKYEVTFDDLKLDELKKKVALNCGEQCIVKEEVKERHIPHSDYFYHRDDGFRHYYTDIHYEKSGNKGTEWDHYDEYEVDLYNCVYKDYTCPDFIDFIESINCEDTKAIDQLFRRDFRKVSKFLTVREKIMLLQEEIAKLSQGYTAKRKQKVNKLSQAYEELNRESEDIEKRIKVLHSWSGKTKKELLAMDKTYAERMQELNKRLKYLLSIEKLNERQEGISKYIEELLSLVEFRLVDTISLDLINRVRSFQSQEVPVKEPQLVKQN